MTPQPRPPLDPTIDKKSRDPLSPQEQTLILGLGLIAGGFILAQLLSSILFAPLALIVPGFILTLTAVIARPEAPE